MLCLDCRKPILNDWMGHLNNEGNIEHVHHQNCLIVKLAKKLICPICKVPYHLDSIPSPKKEEILEEIEWRSIVESVKKDPWVIVASIVSGIAGGIIGGLTAVLFAHGMVAVPAITLAVCFGGIYALSKYGDS